MDPKNISVFALQTSFVPSTGRSEQSDAIAIDNKRCDRCYVRCERATNPIACNNNAKPNHQTSMRVEYVSVTFEGFAFLRFLLVAICW